MPTEVPSTDVVEDIRRRAGSDKRIAFLSGNFNVLHPGHLRILKFAKENGDFLVVGLNPDTTQGVTLPAELRREALSAISTVDYIVLLHEAPEHFIAKLKPDVVVKGKEYESRSNPEQAVVDAYGGKLILSSGEMRFASFNLLHREYFQTDFSTIEKPLDFPERRGFRISDLKGTLAKFAGLRVLVVGDLIVDSYVDCDPVGMSQEDPTIVVTPIEEKTFVGGAGIVAAHARGLGAEVRFISVAGKDEAAAFARTALEKYGVEPEVLYDSTRPTTHKRRYRAQGKTMLRVNQMRQHAIGPELVSRFADAIRHYIDRTDLLLFSDFNYGCLPQALVDRAIDMARTHAVMMTADSQASSQLADIARFRGMELITPTELEARLALRDQDSGLVVLGERLQKAAAARNVIITLAAEGLLIHGKENGEDGEYVTDRLPAFNSMPKDVAGAGDSFFTCCSLARCAGADIWQSSYLAAIAAACQISRVGNMPLSVSDIITEIEG